jgi:hypothetical protein
MPCPYSWWPMSKSIDYVRFLSVISSLGINMDKKTKEKSILEMVYGKDRFDEIIAGENPDFKIRNKHQCDFFGVEVTELYYSEAYARLDNIPGYFTEILDNKQYRHKKDTKDLEVKQFTLLSDGKPDRQVEGILQELLPVSHYIQTVIDIINNKNARTQCYKQGLTHVNLIINDMENRLVTLPLSDFYNKFFIPNLRVSLCKSTFREVYFITSLEANKRVYFPLKMLFLISELYLFDGALKHYYPTLDLKSPKEELALFAYYLSQIGINEIYVSDEADGLELIYGNSGVILTDERGMVIRDHADYQLPNSASHYTGENLHGLTDDAFKTHIKEFACNNTFVTELAFEVNSLN